jgi:hypothetical protein
MSTARMTFGTILGTVSTSAVAISTVIGTGVKGINMLEKFVDDAATKQHKRSLLDMESFQTRLLEEVAQEDAERGLKLDEFMSKSAQHRELYKLNYERLAAVLEADKQAKA